MTGKLDPAHVHLGHVGDEEKTPDSWSIIAERVSAVNSFFIEIIK